MQTMSRCRSVLTLAGAWAGLSLALGAPLWAQEPAETLIETKLVADDGIDGDNFGTALAIEGDTLVVAAPGADLDDQDAVDSSGVVYVFGRDQADGPWLQQQILVPSRGHYEGNFLDMTLALQGDTLAVGAPYATLDRFQEGAVYVFQRDESGTWAQSARITDVSVGYNGHFGISLALDGDLLAVGATQEYFDVQGRVGIFARDRGGPDNWGRVTTVYGFNWADAGTSPNDAGNPRSFGGSVALAGDLLLVGAARTTVAPNNSDGALYLFGRDASDPDRWTYLSRLVRPGADDCVDGLPLSQFYLEATAAEIEAAAECARQSPFRSSNFGQTVLIEGDSVLVGALDGHRRLIGAKGDHANRGAVYLHEPAVPDEPEEPPAPAYAATGELVDDSVLEDASGVILGAVEGAALPTLPVWVHEVSPPSEPLFAGARPIGSYYNVGAVRTTHMPNDTPFGVGLPVPESADTRSLAVAALVPAEQLLDGTSAGMVWTPVTGFYDADHALYVVSTAELAIEGSTVVLIEHPDLVMAGPQTPSVARALVGTSSNFEVSCYQTNCDETLQRTLDQLERAYAEYSKFFTEPHLNRKRWQYCPEQMIWCSLGASGPFKGINLYKESVIASPLCDGAPAATNGGWKSINICIEVQNHTFDYFDATVSHELFHVYQYSLDSIWTQYKKNDIQYWIMEATASAAAGSLTSLVVPPGSSLARDWTYEPPLAVRRVDFSLTVPNDSFDKHNYEAQDFWVYLGQARQQNLGYLKYMIAEGVTAPDVDSRIALHFGSSLADEYWGWVKNQVMLEDDINFFPDGPGPNPPPLDQPPCRIQPKAVKHDDATMALMLDHTMTINQPGHDSVGLQLLPLQSDVVEITFEAGTTTSVYISAIGTGFKHKVYLDPVDVDDAACRNVEDGDRMITYPLPLGAKAYVLVSNTTSSGSSPSTYEVRVDVLD